MIMQQGRVITMVRVTAVGSGHQGNTVDGSTTQAGGADGRAKARVSF